MSLCIVSCFMHAYDRSLVITNITLTAPCLISINSSLHDLIESEYYMLIPMQHTNVLEIFNSFYINFQSSSYANYHAWRQRVLNFPQKFRTPLALWHPRGVTSIADKALTSVTPRQSADLLDSEKMRMWARTLLDLLSFCARPCGLDFPFIQPKLLGPQQISCLALLSFLPGKKLPITTEPE